MSKVLHNRGVHAPFRVAGQRGVVLQGGLLQQELAPADETIRGLVGTGRGHMDCRYHHLDNHLPDAESEMGRSGGLHIYRST